MERSEKIFCPQEGGHPGSQLVMAQPERRKKALFIMAPIRSHLLPSFYLANVLRQQYDIHYATGYPVLTELVEAQGFRPVNMTTERFASGVDALRAYVANKQKVNFRFFKNAIRDSFYRKVYLERQKELKQMLDTVQPDVIFIDIFSATDFLVLYPHLRNIHVAFVNPMLTTYNLEKYPNVVNDTMPVKRKQYGLRYWFHRLSPVPFLALLVGYNPKWQLNWVYRRYNIPEQFRVTKENSTVRIMPGVPELLMAPLELEFEPAVRRPNQHYMGLSVNTSRVDTELDPVFVEQFEQLVKELKAAGKKIVYCAFGTFFSKQEEHQAVASFCLALFGAFYNLPGYHFILSINQDIINAIQKVAEFPANFSYYTRLRQLKALEVADVFITHGGLGSVKEGIAYGVPMLAYPIDLRWDQKGNALKIAHHKIGLRGDLRKEEPLVIKEKLLELCHNPLYKNNIMAMKQAIGINYPASEASDTIHRHLMYIPA
jgi:UDP:flavonoid glycosyltransferase YjiC (YdhE family)